MPIYAYRCKNAHEFELIKRLEDRDKPQRCPECSSTHTRRTISRSSFRLVGSGWYRDGYGS